MPRYSSAVRRNWIFTILVSTLQNLCITAAFCPVREIMEKEKKEKSLAIAEGRPAIVWKQGHSPN
uniref:Secreted protein n=1 Tax=Setaria italica TaxID=4555 RepID=K3ZFL9_SETIT